MVSMITILRVLELLRWKTDSNEFLTPNDSVRWEIDEEQKYEKTRRNAVAMSSIQPTSMCRQRWSMKTGERNEQNTDEDYHQQFFFLSAIYRSQFGLSGRRLIIPSSSIFLCFFSFSLCRDKSDRKAKNFFRCSSIFLVYSCLYSFSFPLSSFLPAFVLIQPFLNGKTDRISCFLYWFIPYENGIRICLDFFLWFYFPNIDHLSFSVLLG